MSPYPPCTLCDEIRREVLFNFPYGDIVCCARCSLVSLIDPNSKELVGCSYDTSYYSREAREASVGYPDYFGVEAPERMETAQVFASFIRRLRPDAMTSLDVGCGGGYLAEALAHVGLTATGVDTSTYAIDRARQVNSAATFLHGGLQDRLVCERGPYDVVTVMDTIEHVSNPVHLIREAAARTAYGGVLTVLTPRFGGHLMRTQGREWVHFNTDHMHYFTETTLSMVFEKAVPRVKIEIYEPVDAVRRWGVEVPPGFVRKYTRERDSIIAIAYL